MSSLSLVEQGGSSERGFSLTELLIAMVVFLVIIGSVIGLMTKSQMIFRTEQGVAEMDQNARLLIDFLTRDIQQSKESSLGLGPKFRSIFSHSNLDGKTDELTIVSSGTETSVPAHALPLTAATIRPFSVADGYVEVLPNGAGNIESLDVIRSLAPGEDFVVSANLQSGSVQFDFIRVHGAKLTHEGFIGLSFSPVIQPGVQTDVPFGSVYENGTFTMRPVLIKRYFVDESGDADHPVFAMSVNDGEPMPIARNIVAFQLRYLEVRDGEVEGRWAKEQNISSEYRTLAVEVTMTARTEISGDPGAERLVTLASVVRPRTLPDYGTIPGGGGGTPGVPGDWPGGGPGDPGFGDGGPGGDSGGGDPRGGFPSAGGGGNGGGFGGGGGGFGSGGYRHESRRIGKPPRLGERLNPNR